MNSNDQASIEIDVFYLLRKLWSKKFFIIFIALVVGTVALLGSIFLIKPKYTSTTRIYVVSKTADNITSQDLQAGSYLVNDYKEVITSSEVLSSVIDQQKLALSTSELSDMITVDIPTDTRVISISVEDTDAKEAADIANAVREIAAEKIKAVTKVDETTLEAAATPKHPSSPNVKKNLALGILVGGALAVIVILVVEVLDDRVRRPEDIEEVLGMTLLGVVPDIDKM